MTFQPLVPIGGYAGWVFLNRNLERQLDLHSDSPSQKRDSEYFAENIAKVRTAEELVSDRRLLRVALGAFGLDDDLDNRFFVRKVLEGRTDDSDSLANKLADKSYLKLAEAFGFGQAGMPRTALNGFAAEIVTAFERRQFEIAVGDQSEDFRLALAAKRELSDLAARDLSADGKWFAVMGSPPLRRVFETAFGLPNSFSGLDLDYQLQTFRERSERAFGDSEIGAFGDPEKIDNLVQTFLLRSEIANSSLALSSGNIALTLLASVQSA